MFDTRPAREDLLRRVEQVLQFALEATDVVPAIAVKPDGRDRHIRQKYVAETGLLLYALHGIPDLPAPLSARIDVIAAKLAAPARDQRMLALMHMKPSTAAELAVGHLCLAQIGQGDAWFQEQIAGILGSPLCAHNERLPWKDIEAAWFAEKSGLPTFAADRTRIGRTTLALGLHAYFPSRDELYAFTHALIYLSDFGRRGVQLDRPAGATLLDAECALAQCLDDDDFDLAAELLMTWPSLDLEWTDTAALAFDVLCAIEDEVGYLPSLSVRSDAMASLDAEARKQFFYLEAYHTVFVMGLLCAALLARGYADGRPTSPADDRRDTPGISRTQREPMPQWELRLDRLPRSARDRYFPFILSVELKRALASGDVRGFRDLLGSALVASEYDLPAVKHGIAILEMMNRAAIGGSRSAAVGRAG